MFSNTFQYICFQKVLWVQAVCSFTNSRDRNLAYEKSVLKTRKNGENEFFFFCRQWVYLKSAYVSRSDVTWHNVWARTKHKCKNDFYLLYVWRTYTIKTVSLHHFNGVTVIHAVHGLMVFFHWQSMWIFVF